MNNQSNQCKCPCLSFSKKLWEVPVRGVIFAILANIYFISFWKAGSNLFSIAIFTALLGLLICCAKKLLGKECCCENEKKEEMKEAPKPPEALHGFLKQVVSLENPFYTVKVIIGLYLLYLFIGLFSDHFIVFFIMNFGIFYALIDKFCPNFLFKIFLFVKQIVEGILGVIECAIPKYEEPKNEEQAKESKP